MKTTPTCVTCILGDVYAAAQQVTPDVSTQLKVARNCMTFLAEQFGHERVPSYYITEVHRILKRHTGVPIPFEESRRQLNQVGLVIGARLQQEAERLEGEDRFRFL